MFWTLYANQTNLLGIHSPTKITFLYKANHDDSSKPIARLSNKLEYLLTGKAKEFFLFYIKS